MIQPFCIAVPEASRRCATRTSTVGSQCGTLRSSGSSGRRSVPLLYGHIVTGIETLVVSEVDNREDVVETVPRDDPGHKFHVQVRVYRFCLKQFAVEFVSALAPVFISRVDVDVLTHDRTHQDNSRALATPVNSIQEINQSSQPIKWYLTNADFRPPKCPWPWWLLMYIDSQRLASYCGKSHMRLLYSCQGS